MAEKPHKKLGFIGKLWEKGWFYRGKMIKHAWFMRNMMVNITFCILDYKRDDLRIAFVQEKPNGEFIGMYPAKLCFKAILMGDRGHIIIIIYIYKG